MKATGQEIARARQEEPFLERFIEAYQPFILRTASQCAGFSVTRSDDEFSIALLAFYEAVRQYDPAGGSFGAFAALVIRHRLADYYRALRHFAPEIPLAPQAFDGTVDQDEADATLQMAVSQRLSRSDETSSAAWEIEAADEQLARYGFRIADLSACAPHTEKPRRDCARAIAVLLHDPALFGVLKRQQRLPVKQLAQASRVRQNVIERHRRYIIAAAVLMSGDYPRLCSYLQTVKQEMRRACPPAQHRC